ncbi:hypothetical protein [Vibrio jasicida]|uniref:hypothetical protein n=1 Tax=Vibrio jasicida TaxID=766224 RepID=UPI0005EF6D08|nr:hypothetical protein [Vibrio jasicida]
MRKYFNKYVSELTYILLGFYLFAVVYSFANDKGKPVIEILNSIGVFLSSGGAIVAFITLLNVIMTKRTAQEDSEVEFSNYILLILDRQSRFLKMVLDDITLQEDNYKFSSTTDRALGLIVAEFDESLIMPINLEKSLFLLSLETPDVVGRLDQCQRDFMYLARNVSNRNDSFLNDYQKVVQHYLKPDEKFTKEQIEEKIGNAVIPSLLRSTDSILHRSKLLYDETIELNSELLKLLRKKYPDKKFIISSTLEESA